MQIIDTQNSDDGLYHVIYDLSEIPTGVNVNSLRTEITQNRNFRPALQGVNITKDNQNNGTVEFVFWHEFINVSTSEYPRTDQQILDDIVLGETRRNGYSPFFQIDGEVNLAVSKEQDGRQLVAVSPYPQGWNTFFAGKDDDSNGLSGGNGFGLDLSSGDFHKKSSFRFRENIRLYDAKMQYGDIDDSDPQNPIKKRSVSQISPDSNIDSYCLSISVPGNTFSPSAGTGNVRYAEIMPTVWGFVPDSTATSTHRANFDYLQYGVFFKGGVSPVTAPSKNGWWDLDESTGVLSPAKFDDAGNPTGFYNVLEQPIEFFYMKDMAFLGINGHIDIEVPKTELFHHSWNLNFYGTKSSPGSMWLAVNIMLARKNTTQSAAIVG